MVHIKSRQIPSHEEFLFLEIQFTIHSIVFYLMVKLGKFPKRKLALYVENACNKDWIVILSLRILVQSWYVSFLISSSCKFRLFKILIMWGDSSHLKSVQDKSKKYVGIPNYFIIASTSLLLVCCCTFQWTHKMKIIFIREMSFD